ncbi:hypothetical protein M1843_16620 [Isoptericola sp. 4D.3]|uniref:Uncharacterized protein n=1 Tax=Isoptericola peretonis TaxID=2918523 RepID=A0ABT0J7B0_9MICO|nr:hypothetical protein [Isoptericola sp. 4D.3]
MTISTGGRRVAAGAVALAVGLAGAGCTVASRQEPGQATAAVADALAEAGSAAETTRLTVELLDQGRVTGPVADTALLDQLRVLDDAESALTTLVPPDAASSGHRAAGLTAVGDVSDVVVSAREWVAARSGGDLDDAVAVPADADELLAELGAVTAAVDAALAEAGGR